MPEKPRPTTLAQLLKATQTLKSEPVITLAMDLEQLGILHPREIQMLADEDRQLLRSRSAELVDHLLMTNEDLHHALARTAGIVEVDAAHFVLPQRTFDVQLLRKMRAHDLLFLGEADDTIYMATWYPTDETMRNRLRSLTSRSVRLVWADRDAIAARLERMDPQAPMKAPEHDMLQAHQAFIRKASSTPPAATHAVTVHDEDMAHLMSETVRALASKQAKSDMDDTEESSDSPSMVRMIMDAQALHASDIHIETNPGEEFTRIRLRRDGDLELYQKLPPTLSSAMVSRIKIMARLDISEHRRPQDGKINFSEFGGEALELRVSIMPTHDGMEDVVMRLLASSKPVPLGKLGLQPRDAEAVARMSARSFGLILAAGPTGSGKTTTLHSMLAEINIDERKIWTAEDPIEITQPGLRQVQVNPKIGLTFASAMRGFLRADPDVIMIGEIRDTETARIVIEASLTGHLVLSTLHTNSASESVVRLLDLGMDAMNFADSLVGIIAQRLVRSLCPHCAQKAPLPGAQFPELVKAYVHASPPSGDEGRQRLLTAAGLGSPEELTLKDGRWLRALR
ncbi:GspE/PulE family protein [Polaromonas glacialis]|uniref:GspE/PulE family protein n=1 Tax=Polaromonas glacialis TaxID=866564 RepID=UPI00068A26AE|nr:GspE/PulE family protein [Polaromonas glacialis]